nr:hypothetical protein [Tanacetum cinerariifolium]
MINLTTFLLSFWDYALETAIRILKMVPTKKVDKMPCDLWYGKVPNLSYLKVWGCEALVKRDTPDKLQQRSVKCIFIRYPNEMMVYYFYFPPENKIVVARYADFLKKNLISQEVSWRAVELEEIQDEDTPPSKNTSKIPIAVEDSESNKWLDAMNAEMQSMKDNQVCFLVDLPPNGFVDPNHPRKVCKLQRSIYGLKQASRSWNKRFDEEIKRFGFAANLDEPCVYQKASGSRCLKEKLSGSNFNDWFRSPKMVLRVEKKLFVIEQPIFPALPPNSKHLKNSSPYEMLQELKLMCEKQAEVERFDLTQTFHACKEEEEKPVGPHVIKMKNYVAVYFKKAATPQVMAIQGGRIQKTNKKSLNDKGKGK